MSESEIDSKTQQAIHEHACILINGDNLLVGNLGRVIKMCSEARIPLYVGDPDSVRKGAVAAVGPSYYSLGQQAGVQATKILNEAFAGCNLFILIVRKQFGWPIAGWMSLVFMNQLGSGEFGANRSSRYDR